MGQIRKQAILSSIVIYTGFLIGFVNTWFFIKSGTGSFTPAQYGLTRLFFDVGQLMYAVASFGVVSVLYKFFPYYRDHLPPRQNDLYTWTLVFPLIGFFLVVLGGMVFEPLVVQKFSGRSALFVDYYPWVFVFGFGILAFTILEGFSWTFQQAVFPSFLRETGLRLLTLVLIVLYSSGTINFDTFMRLFAFLFLAIAAILGVRLRAQQLWFITLRPSRVTRRFGKKMVQLAAYVYSGSIILILSQVADSIIIASVSEKGIHDAGVYNLATYIANLIQVPQRSIIAVTVPVLSIAWKQKNLAEINRLYQRSSINLLLIGLVIFIGIWLNIEDAFRLLRIQTEYEAGIMVVLLLGITKLIDAGTGVNAQIIATSIHWRFEFVTGVLLVLLILPLNYVLVKQYGITGSAYANLLSFSVYNLIRYVFLWKRYRLQPFSSKTLLSLLLGVGCYVVCAYLLNGMSGFWGIAVRSSVFVALFTAGVFAMKLTPDAHQLWAVAKQRLGF
ncbi:MAG: lipopolysaccharide biosynthesis protein [Lacibacter sp.]